MDTVSIIIPSNSTPSSPNPSDSSDSSSAAAASSSLSSCISVNKKRTSLTEEEDLHEAVLRAEAAKATVANALKIAMEAAEIATKTHEELAILQQAYATKKRVKVTNDELRQVINVNLVTPTNVVLEEQVMVTNQSILDNFLSILETSDTLLETVEILVDIIL